MDALRIYLFLPKLNRSAANSAQRLIFQLISPDDSATAHHHGSVFSHSALVLSARTRPVPAATFSWPATHNQISITLKRWRRNWHKNVSFCSFSWIKQQKAFPSETDLKKAFEKFHVFSITRAWKWIFFSLLCELERISASFFMEIGITNWVVKKGLKNTWFWIFQDSWL